MSFTMDLADHISDLTTDSIPDPPRPIIKDENAPAPQKPKVSAQVEEEIRHHYAPPQKEVKSHSETQEEEKFESLPKEHDKAPPPRNSKKGYNPKKSDKSRSGKKLPKSPQGAATTEINIVESSGIHFGSSYSITVMPNSSKESKDHTLPTNMPSKAQINELRKCVDRVSLRDIDAISGEIGETWKNLGRHLNCSESQMQQFYIDHNALGIKEVVIQMLLDWQRVNTVEASIRNLCDALLKSEQGDALQALIDFRTKLKN